MKLVSVGLARSIYFFDTNELNPGGKDIFTEVVPAFTEEYNFNVVPQPGGDFKGGMKFANGSFVNKRGETLVVSATIWSDGVGADSFSSTADSDEFLEEALGMLPDLGFAYDTSMIRRKGYLSQLHVKSSVDLGVLNPKLTEIASKLSLISHIPFSVAAVELWPDQTQSNKPANFSLQRKIGEPPSSDRYWSQAGMPTDKHLQLLEEIETLLR